MAYDVVLCRNTNHGDSNYPTPPDFCVEPTSHIKSSYVRLGIFGRRLIGTRALSVERAWCCEPPGQAKSWLLRTLQVGEEASHELSHVVCNFNKQVKAQCFYVASKGIGMA